MEDLSNVEWINAKQRLPLSKRIEPPIDELVSKIVGKKIYQRDPRLLKLIIKWKNQKEDSETPDDFLRDERKVKELKEVLNPSI